jgi:hypothetical protein
MYVEYFGASEGFYTLYKKRSIDGRDIEESIVRIIHAFHDNGTVEVRHQPVFQDEVRIRPLQQLVMRDD